MQERNNNLVGHYLSFRLSELTFGISTNNIHTIIGLGGVHWISQDSATGRKTFTFRGNTVPAVHLGVAFGLKTCDLPGDSAVIIVHPDHIQTKALIGIFADDVLHVVHISAAQIDPVPDACQKHTRELLLGVGKAGSNTLALLDPQKVAQRFLGHGNESPHSVKARNNRRDSRAEEK